jgi:hypothetical protein
MDDILSRIARGNLTESDRRELVEQYKAEQMKVNHYKAKKGEVLSKEDMLNLPRHKMWGKCLAFQECPLCFKCRNYDPSHLACRNCELNKEGLICNTQKHNEKVLNMMIRRERIDLDGDSK